MIGPRFNPLVIVLAVVLTAAGPLAGQENSVCLECHGKPGLRVERDGRSISLSVEAEQFAQSVHAALDCVSCHTQLEKVEKYPHATGLGSVQCEQCHEDDNGPFAAYWYSTHGQRVKAGDKDAPHCQDCHGDHYILPLSDRGSAVSPFNIPLMCAQCHA